MRPDGFCSFCHIQIWPHHQPNSLESLKDPWRWAARSSTFPLRRWFHNFILAQTWKGVVPICPCASESANEASLLAKSPEGKTCTRGLSDPTIWEVGCHEFFDVRLYPLSHLPSPTHLLWQPPSALWLSNGTSQTGISVPGLFRFNQVGEFPRSLIRLTTFLTLTQPFYLWEWPMGVGVWCSSPRYKRSEKSR